MGYPPAPWRMHGDLWLTLFKVRGAVGHPDGVYGAAWVDYTEPSPLAYHELLTARLRRDRPGSPVTITEIWVDSEDSRDGGRALWAIPKGLADFTVEKTRTGPLQRAAWHAEQEAGVVASARFTDLAGLAPRLPFRGATLQPPLDGGTGAEVSATLRGSSRSVPARGSWWFATDGPLGWLNGQRQLASFRMADFRMSFG